MIRELSIKNFALINHLSIQFDKGFSIFTGETGTGKSILIGALGMLLGERASSESVRSGYSETEINGIFELDTITKPLLQQLSEADISVDDNTLIIRRLILKNGKNRIYVNQTPVPLNTLKSIGNYLVDMHGQHDHQSLLRQETASILINSLPDVKEIWETFCLSYKNYLSAKNSLETFNKKAAELGQKLDLLEFQYSELENMKLADNEENALKEEYTLITSITDRLERIAAIHSVIEGTDGNQSLERQLIQIRKNLESLQKLDTSADPWINDIENVLTLISELSSYCNSYSSQSETSADPARIEHINSRMAKIQQLKRKYSCSFEELIQKKNELKEQLFSLENVEAERVELEKNAAQLENLCRKYGKELSTARKKATQKFDLLITEKMEHLGFNGGKWKTTFTPEPSLSANGLESILFEVQTNSGEPTLPLVKIASGGEISRLMLAIKTVLARHDNIPVLIFDEIDTGIGGHLAKTVGNSLYGLSKTHQVLCISHLHQIASLADHHYRVFKTVEENRTVVNVQPLNEKDKIEEISRMLGSDSSISKKHAEEMLAQKDDT